MNAVVSGDFADRSLTFDSKAIFTLNSVVQVFRRRFFIGVSKISSDFTPYSLAQLLGSIIENEEFASEAMSLLLLGPEGFNEQRTPCPSGY